MTRHPDKPLLPYCKNHCGRRTDNGGWCRVCTRLYNEKYPGGVWDNSATSIGNTLSFTPTTGDLLYSGTAGTWAVPECPHCAHKKWWQFWK